MSDKRVLLFANTDWYLYNFRLAMANRLRDLGWEVVLVAPSGPYGQKLIDLGFRFLPFDFSTKSTNPFHELAVVWRLIKLYRQLRPRMVHHFTIKCVLYGTLAARCAGVRAIVNAITGLGHIFTDRGMKALLLRPLVRLMYRAMLAGNRVRVIFQNQENCDVFLGHSLVTADRVSLIRGSGVDCEEFRPDASRLANDGQVRILFASRLLREKGVFELISAYREVRAEFPQVHLFLAGDVYPENPSSLSAEDLDQLATEEGIHLLGHIDGIKSQLAQADIVVLPSYAEGTPRILIEAAAMERPIVATDIAGHRGLVEDGVNGLLVPVRTVEPLVVALLVLCKDAELRQAMGGKGREIVLEGFSQEQVLDRTFAVYRDLLPEHFGPLNAPEPAVSE